MIIKSVMVMILSLFSSVTLATGQMIWLTSNNHRLLTEPEGELLASTNPTVNVYKLYYQVIQNSDEDKLRSIFSYLKKNNIEVAVELPALTWDEHGKGYKVEGFTYSGFFDEIVDKVKRSGGSLDYIAIDEIIYYGHFSKGNNKPGFSVKYIADESAKNLKPVVNSFPNVKIGIIEPFTQINDSNGLGSITEFINNFEIASGKKISFLHYDVLWPGEWNVTSKSVKKIADEHKIRYGVIFNANTNDPSYLWMIKARENIRKYLSSDAPMPDDVIIQSWNRKPEITFPQNNPHALYSLAPYFNIQTEIRRK